MKVVVFGTFDLLHEGHLYFIKEAKKLGEELTVVVARDKNVEKFKHKSATHNEEERLKNVQNIPEVDNTVLGDEEDIYKVIENEKPDIIALGYDQNEQNIYEELEKRGIKIKVIRLEGFEEKKYKTSLLCKNE